MNTKANPSIFDAYENALPNEPIFTLRASDPSASDLVMEWARLRAESIAAGKHPKADEAKITMAKAVAYAMMAWQNDRKHLTEATFPQGQLPFLRPQGHEAQILRTAVLRLVGACHGASRSAGWWTNLADGTEKQRNIGEALMLIVSEVAEAMEGHRKNLDDDKLPHFKMIEVELADAVIRIADLAGGMGYRLAEALVAKLAFNSVRPDHKIEARRAEDGKKY